MAYSGKPSGITPGTYGDGTHVAQVSVNAEGQVTNVSSVGITTGGTGTVTSVGLSSTDLTVSGSPITTSGSITANLTTTGVSAGTYGDSTHVAQITVDSKGRATAVSSVAIAAGGTGTVTSVGLSSTDLTVSGSPITTSGTITADLTTTGVSAGTYGDSTHVAQITVDTKGRISAVTNVAVAGGGSLTPKSATGITTPFSTNLNTASVTEVDGRGVYLSGAVSANQLRGVAKTLPAADTTITALVYGTLLANYNSIGLAIRDSSGGRSIGGFLVYNGGYTFEVQTRASDTAVPSGTIGPGATPGPVYIRAAYVNSTKAITISFSLDGQTWQTVVSASTYVVNPDQIVLAYCNRNATYTGGGFICYYDDGTTSFDFNPYTVYS